MLSKFQGIQSDMNAVVMKRVALIFEALLINTLIDFLFDIFVKLKVQSLFIELFLIFFHNIKTLDFINLFQLKIVIKKCLGDHFGCPNNYVSFFTCYYPRTMPPERCLGYYKTCTVLLGMQKLTLYLITLTPNPIHGIP